MADVLNTIREQLAESCRVKQSFSPELLQRIAAFGEHAVRALRRGGKLVWFGNGGSAADAQHLAAELTVRLQKNRPGLAALALTTNTSVLTAAGNDFGFEEIFARQAASLVQPADLVVALSTSGNSRNVVRGAESSRARGAFVVGMTGAQGGALSACTDLLLNVPSEDPQRIQEAHITIGHIVCGLIESDFFAEKS